jgi:glutamyl-tRNA reductase
MPFIALGLNHQTAPIALREIVAVTSEQLPMALNSLKALPGVNEAAVLSTCNRTEIYAQIELGADGQLRQWLSERHHVPVDVLQTYFYQHDADAAVKHLFRVAAGLDSQILGEPQILGQVKQAWQSGRDAKTVNGPLDRLFQQTFAVAKRVRTDTQIGLHPVSIAYAAVRMAQRLFSEINKATVLLIGAGDTIELSARHLNDAKVKRLLVANRTLEHAQQLASQHGGVALSLQDLSRHLFEADIVISATASREPILDKTTVKAALTQRRQRPMFFLDLAVPRDIDNAVRELPDAYLYTVDDLEQAIEDNRASRREAADEAEVIIDLQTQHFMAWSKAQQQHEVLKKLRADSESIRDKLLSEAQANIANGQNPQEALEILANQLTNKLLHGPSIALRQAAMRGDIDTLRAAEKIYSNEPQDKDP